jgi:hypothetical protein
MVDAKRTTGVDVKRTMQTASMDVAIGRKGDHCVRLICADPAC